MIRVLDSKNIEGLHGEVRYQKLAGNSQDQKPSEGLATGSIFVETDTLKSYVYDEDSDGWTELQGSGGGGGGGDGGSASDDVVFYDYDGTVVNSYSAADFAALSAMPANPSHSRLVAQGWNWSLADAKAYVAEYGKLNIGQMYVTESGATEIDVEMHEGRLSPILTICVNGTITVDWGDNTTPDTVTGTSLSDRLAVPHTYANEGNYTISILGAGDNKYCFLGGNYGSYTILRRNTTANENFVYANTVKNIRIGNNAEIASDAFYFCYSLSNITIPNSVTSIGDNAFYSCYSLSNIILSDSVTNIGNNAFYYCYSLSNIILSDSVTSIGKNVFYFCCSLPNITIPNSVTSIGDSAFDSCYSLTNITIPNSVTSIGYSAFNYCLSFSNITIPNSVTSIGDNAFNYCYSLSNIILSDSVTSIGKNAFYSCYSLSNITIPDNVTSIGNYAFNYCYSLANIEIPDGVTSIGNSVFSYCYGMKEYHILPTTVPTCGAYMFRNLPSDCIIYVPYSADHSILNAYKTATNWSSYASYMQEEPT